MVTQEDRRTGVSASPSTGVQVLGKAASLLDHLADEPELTAAQLAALTGEPRSTAHRLLGTLEALGYVEPGHGRGTYRLGLRLLELGTAVQQRFDVRKAGLPAMQHVHRETGETVFLCVRRGHEAVCIERLDGRRVQSLALQLGGRLPLHAGAAPRVLLAYEGPEFWQQYCAEVPTERFTPRTPTTAEQLWPILEEVLETGLSVSNQDVTVGIAALGCPVFDHSGRVVAAVSISGVAETLLGDDGERIRGLIIQAGHQISRELGHLAAREEARPHE